MIDSWRELMTATNGTPAQAPISAMRAGSRLRVLHFVDSAGAADRLWGKENVIVSLMEAQRASGQIDAELVTFTSGLLDSTMQAAGFRVHSLDSTHRRLPVRALAAFRSILAAGSPAVVHTHEYKANIVGRLARATGAPMRKLVATCHGWVDRSVALDAYFAFDRLTAPFSDVVTVTDPAMISRFPSLRPRRLVFVQNAITNGPLPASTERLAARARFGFPEEATVIGSMGRLTKNKGILDILAAARRTTNEPIIWAVAGSGALTADVAQCGLPNVRFVGYQADNAGYLAALDVYLQASHFEGLSLSLLEAMRAGLPSVSTRAGATEMAIRDGSEAILIDAGDIDAIVDAARRLHADAPRRVMLGANARARFDAAFAIERQQAAFLELYLG